MFFAWAVCETKIKDIYYIVFLSNFIGIYRNLSSLILSQFIYNYDLLVKYN